MQAETQVYAIQTQKDKLDEAMQKILNKGGFALAAGEPVGNQQKYAELELAAAQQVLDDLQNGPTIDQRRIAEARIGVAQAQVKVAQARLDLLKAGATGGRYCDCAGEDRSGQSRSRASWKRSWRRRRSLRHLTAWWRTC